jgi:hypothetical protein
MPPRVFRQRAAGIEAAAELLLNFFTDKIVQ